jgi:hypothetical protein
MDQKIDWDLEYISGVLSDIEVIDLPWSDLEKVSIGIDWDTALGRYRRLDLKSFDNQQIIELGNIKQRLSIQKSKIQELGFDYPEIG